MSLSATLPLARRGFGILLAGAALILALAVLVPALLGYQRYVITSGSMTGTYDRGSLVFDKVVPTSSLRAGDVITFRPPGHAGLVTHRIHTLTSVDGKRVLTTKGDANRVRRRLGRDRRSAHAQPGARRLPPSLPRLRPGRPQREARAHARHRPPRAAHRHERAGRAVARLRPGRASAVGMTRLVVLLAAVLAAAAAVQGSQATFTASKTNSGSSFVTASKFPPTVTLTAPANGSATNDTTPTLSGAADNATGDATTVTVEDLQRHDRDRHRWCRRKTATRSGTTLELPLATALAPGHLHRVSDADRHVGQHRHEQRQHLHGRHHRSPTATSIVGRQQDGRHRGQDRGRRHAHLHLLRGRSPPASVWTRLERREHRGPHQVHEQRQRHDHRAHHRRRGADQARQRRDQRQLRERRRRPSTRRWRCSADGTSVVVTLGTPSNVSPSASPGRNMTLDAQREHQGPRRQRGARRRPTTRPPRTWTSDGRRPLPPRRRPGRPRRRLRRLPRRRPRRRARRGRQRHGAAHRLAAGGRRDPDGRRPGSRRTRARARSR